MKRSGKNLGQYSRSFSWLNSKEFLNQYLSFCKDGWTFAIDFPKKTFNTKSLLNFNKKLQELDGLIYLAKDSVLDESSFKLMYKKFNEWEKVVKYYDPKNLFQSQISHRLGLKNW